MNKGPISSTFGDFRDLMRLGFQDDRRLGTCVIRLDMRVRMSDMGRLFLHIRRDQNFTDKQTSLGQGWTRRRQTSCIRLAGWDRWLGLGWKTKLLGANLIRTGRCNGRVSACLGLELYLAPMLDTLVRSYADLV